MSIAQVTIAMSNIERVIQENSAKVEETSAASKEMRGQAEQMNNVVARLVALVGADTKPLIDDVAENEDFAVDNRVFHWLHRVTRKV
ncbi:MAG: hypothetical protein P4L55_15435 [Syntrophobacteraceae bacterium]|nr:hypothetical protein [Syntrophobacteraceae bacterium]